MRKYMKKLKIAGDMRITKLSHPSPLSVRTRAAKTLALQRLNSSAKVASPHPPTESSASVSYLQLRSRRLEKPLVPEKKRHQKTRKVEGEGGRDNARDVIDSVGSGFVISVSGFGERDGEGCFVSFGGQLVSDGKFDDLGGIEEGNEAELEASLGENGLDSDSGYRSTTESTPCNFFKDPDTTATPASTTRQRKTSSDQQMARDISRRNMPTTRELDDFFARLEQQQQREFMEKYNFDIVNDKPLHGRYEWIQVIP